MAIIRSMGVGRARKSIGNVTYRTVRGRTIASERVTTTTAGAPTRSDAQSQKQKYFTLISRFVRLHATDIQVSFNRTRFGSQRNNFFKQNYGAFVEAIDELGLTSSASAQMVNDQIGAWATTNPGRIVRVNVTGADMVFMDGPWSSEDNPSTVIPPNPGLVELKVNGSIFEGGLLPAAGSQVNLVGRGLSIEGLTVSGSMANGQDLPASITSLISGAVVSQIGVTGTLSTQAAGGSIQWIRMSGLNQLDFEYVDPSA